MIEKEDAKIEKRAQIAKERETDIMPSTKSSALSQKDADVLRSIVAFLNEKNIFDAIPPILLSSNIGYLDSSMEDHKELMGLQKLVLKGKFEDAIGKKSIY